MGMSTKKRGANQNCWGSLIADHPIMDTLKLGKMPIRKSAMIKPLSLSITPVSIDKAMDASQEVDESLESPIEILPNLYLGSSKIAESSPLLKKYKINAILNVAKEVETPTDGFYEAPRSAPITKLEKDLAFELPTFPIPRNRRSLAVRAVLESASHCRRPSMILDTLEESDIEKSTIEYAKFNWSHYQDNLAQYLNVAFSFIEKQRRKNKNIMIHCQCGVSRSVSIIIAYIMHDQKLSFKDALAIVKSKSPSANPHLSFVCQLIEFEKELQ